MADRFPDKLGDRMIKQLLSSVIAKYLDLSVSRRSIICLSLCFGKQLICSPSAFKSRHAERPIIVHYVGLNKDVIKSLCLKNARQSSMVQYTSFPHF